jgi:hypothetical protein
MTAALAGRFGSAETRIPLEFVHLTTPRGAAMAVYLIRKSKLD